MLSTTNFGLGLPSFESLIAPQGSTIADPSLTAAQRGLDAYQAMNGGGYLGGVVNAPVQYAGPTPQTPVAPQPQPDPQQGGITHGLGHMGDAKWDYFRQGGPGFSALRGTIPADFGGLGGLGGPAQAQPQTGLAPWSHNYGDMTITEGFAPDGATMTTAGKTPWGTGAKPGKGAWG